MIWEVGDEVEEVRDGDRKSLTDWKRREKRRRRRREKEKDVTHKHRNRATTTTSMYVQMPQPKPRHIYQLQELDLFHPALLIMSFSVAILSR